MKSKLYKTYFDEFLEEISTDKLVLNPSYFDSLIIYFEDSLMDFKEKLEDIDVSDGLFIIVVSFGWTILLLFIITAIFHNLYANIWKVLLAKSIYFTNNSMFNIVAPKRYKLLKLTGVLFSAKTQKETFETTMADWDFEIFEAVSKDKNAKLFMINLRNAYAFLIAMWLKTPIGDLIEFVVKIAKG